MPELKISLQPKQQAFRSAIEKYPVVFYGGAKGGGKSKGLRDIFLLRRFEYPGSVGAIFRKTYPDLRDNHINKLFEEHPGISEYWHDGNKELTLPTLPTKSVLKFRYCSNEEDVKSQEGREYHDLGVEEAGQWTETMLVRLRGSNRSSKPGVKARTAMTGNPGGIGHSYLKRVFIERRFNPRERPEDYHFIKALVDDNPALLENDPDYVHRLNAEPNEALRKAYRYGDWDIFAGQFFTELRREIHLVKSFDIPSHWTCFGSYDFGFNHPAAFGWFAVDEDGNVYLYRELVRAQLRVDQFASAIKDYPDTEMLNPIEAGWDCWSKKSVVKSGTPPTIAEEFFNQGLILHRANIDRINGASQVRSYLAWQNKSGGADGSPKFFIFDSCPLSFDALSRMQTDPDRPEDVLKVDASDGDPMSGDDAYDMIRMGLMSRPQLANRQTVRIRAGTPQMIEHTRKLMDAQLQREIDRQAAEEQERKNYETMGMEPGEVASYFINKRRGER